MTLHIQPLPGAEPGADEDTGRGLGALSTARGNLPLRELTVRARITGLVARVELVQRFRNPHPEPLEATYVLPLPDRAAVTQLRMEADGRTVVAELKERAQARADYDRAISSGRRASIVEEDRPDVFTLRVGNILPGEQVVIRLTLVQPLPYADGEAEFRFPLVVAPRYVPGGDPLAGAPTGQGWATDTAEVPDASRITPPVLLPGFPDPVRLAVDVDIDPTGLPLAGVRSSLHAVVQDGGRISLRPGERADRDVVLRLAYGQERATATTLAVADGTFRLTLLPPVSRVPDRPREVVIVLDRSGSMAGWKMVAARRAAARIVDTLTVSDRFAVLSFDHVVERSPDQGTDLAPATDRNRFRAVEHLAGVQARGGTELMAPLQEALALLRPDRTAATRPAGDGPPAGGLATDGPDRVLVLVTDGQVGDEDRILREVTDDLAGLRVHTIGIDRAVNAGFLARLAVLGGGRCELVESEDRLDEAAEHIHRRIAGPLLTRVRIEGTGIEEGTVTPRRPPDLFPGVPLVVTGRCARLPEVRVSARAPAGEHWSATVPASGAPAELVSPTPGRAPAATEPAPPTAEPTPAATEPVPAAELPAPTGIGSAATITALWARAHLRDLEDAYAAHPDDPEELERQILATSLRFGVLCRFTAFVAVDERVVTDGGTPHRVVQPVEPASGWDLLAGRPPATGLPLAAPMAATTQALALGGKRAPRAVGALGGITARAPGARPRGGPVPEGGPGNAHPAGAPGSPPGAAPSGDLVEFLRRELDAARAVAGASPSRRCTHLADLGTRLAAVCTDLRRHRMPEAALDALERLAADLASCGGEETPTGGALEALWERALTVLARAAGHGEPRPPGLPGAGSGEPRPATAGDGSGVAAADTPPRTGFWRRS